jgi:hypothetical protein
VPHVVEPSAGVDRTLLALICEAYDEETVTDEREIRDAHGDALHPRWRRSRSACFPLLKNKPELVAKAREVHALLKPHMMTFYDEGGAIGRRYRRQDEAGRRSVSRLISRRSASAATSCAIRSRCGIATRCSRSGSRLVIARQLLPAVS